MSLRPPQRTRTSPAGSSTGIVEDTCAYTYDIYLVGHKALTDVFVRSALQAIWANVEKLPQFHPGFAEWTQCDHAVSSSGDPLLQRQRRMAGENG